MRLLLSCVLVACAAVSFVAFPAHGSVDGAGLLVRFSATADASERDAAVRSIGGAARGEISAIGVTRVTLPGVIGDSLALMARQPGVIWAEPDRRVTTQFTPNDALYRTDPYAGLGQWGVRIAKVDQAWDFVQGSASVIVATIDTGADPSHPDLASALLPGASFLTALSPDCRNQTSDDNSHGTHVAGIIAAQGNNSIGIAGVAFGVKVLPLKALDCVGAGMNSDIAQAIVYATDHGARIINISLGGPIGSQAILDAVRYAQSHNVLVIAAAGNCGATNPDCPFPNVADFPAAYPGVLAVGATMPDDSRAPFSTQASYLGITAPGFRMVSTTPTYPTYLSSHGAPLNYASFSGTSAAAPFVAGVAALVLSKEPNLTADQLSDRLRRTADDLGDIGPDTSFGAGRVNALRAVTGASGVTSSGYGAVYDTRAVPRAVASGAAFRALVKITNSSTFTWSAGGVNAVRLGYHWLDASGRTIVADGVRTPLAADVPVGTSVAIAANVVAPGVTGNYTLQFDLARDGVGWFSDQQVKTGDVPITVTAGYGATYSPVAPGSTMVTGTPVVLNVAVANTGLRSWPAGGAQPVHLSYHWLAADGSIAVWNGQRAAFAQDVAPGVTATVALPIVPPLGLGRFTLRLDLVEEGVTWFSGQGVPTSDLAYTISNGFAASYSVGNVPTLLPGGRVLVPVTLQNVGIATWPAAGPAPVHLAAHLYDARGNVVAWDGARTVLASDVKAGASVSTALIVDAPLAPGTYRMQVDLVQEGVGWFSGFGSPSAAALIVVIPDYRATLPSGPITVSRSAPRMTLTATNSSSALWSSSGAAPVDISVHWLDASGAVLVWDGPRTMLGRDVAPGDAVTVAVSLGQVPAGAAAVVVDLVSEGVRWFEAGVARPIQFAP